MLVVAVERVLSGLPMACKGATRTRVEEDQRLAGYRLIGYPEINKDPTTILI